jgi:2-amino-4-hydroxy-6-hydroxymethyldihydropteridine diphosphokinase
MNTFVAMFQVYLLLGANLGERFDQMKSAFQEVEKQVGRILQYSSIYETAAWGMEDEPNYLNQVLLVETTLKPLEVLKQINKIEEQLGRVRNLKWESRIIDIDILFYENLLIDRPELTIPHPYLHLRKFTLIPLHEIAPDFMHPSLKKSTKELLNELQDGLDVRKLDLN